MSGSWFYLREWRWNLVLVLIHCSSFSPCPWSCLNLFTYSCLCARPCPFLVLVLFLSLFFGLSLSLSYAFPVLFLSYTCHFPVLVLFLPCPCPVLVLSLSNSYICVDESRECIFKLLFPVLWCNQDCRHEPSCSSLQPFYLWYRQY